MFNCQSIKQQILVITVIQISLSQVNTMFSKYFVTQSFPAMMFYGNAEI